MEENERRSSIRSVPEPGFEPRLLIEWEWRYFARVVDAWSKTVQEGVLFCDPVEGFRLNQMDSSQFSLLDAMITPQILSKYLVFGASAPLIFSFRTAQLKTFLWSKDLIDTTIQRRQTLIGCPVTLQVVEDSSNRSLHAWLYFGTPANFAACREVDCVEVHFDDYDHLQVPTGHTAHATVRSVDWIRALKHASPEIHPSFDEKRELMTLDDGTRKRDLKFRPGPGGKESIDTANRLSKHYRTQYILSMNRLFRSVADMDITVSAPPGNPDGCLALRVHYESCDPSLLVSRHTRLFDSICVLVLKHLCSSVHSYVAFWLAPKIPE